MNNILNKFNEVKIENDNRITEEDKKFCQIHNEAYEKTLKCYKEILIKLIENYNDQIKNLFDCDENTGESYKIYIDMYGDTGINKIIDTIKNLKDKFINKVCYYFEKKYNVTIDKNVIYKKYKDIEIEHFQKENRDKTLKINLIDYVHINYNMIIDEIFIQLGGFSFEEKAINELKQNVRNLFDIRYDKLEVKGKKLKVDSFFYIDSFSKRWGKDEINYNSDNKFNILFKGLSHFEYGITKSCLDVLYNTITQKEGEAVFTTHELIFDKVDSIKLYKNGKLEITFSSAEHALQFAKEYCNYSKAVA